MELELESNIYTCNKLGLSMLLADLRHKKLTKITIAIVDKSLLDLLLKFARTPKEER